MKIGRLLAEELDSLGAASVCFHTDIFELGIHDPSWGRARTLLEYEKALRYAIGGRTALFPTFNYDYFKTRVYDAERDKCQVGALNEHFRLQSDFRRTLTPVFNFCVLNPACRASGEFSFEPQPVPFSEQSTFAEMYRNKTWLAFLGVSLSHSTLIHLCDYRARTGFRYLKKFPGAVLNGGNSMPIDFSFRVRVIHPLMPVTYDWNRLELEMTELGILKSIVCDEAKNTKILLYRADLAVDYWSGILQKDELGLYTEEGKRSVQKLYDTLGYPLTLEMLE